MTSPGRSRPRAGQAAARERLARLRRRLWQPPRPHGEQPRERAVGPLELFYDLAVVVLVGQAAHHLAGHLTWGGLGEFVAVFALIWIAWINASLHHELHGREDARSRSTFLLQILVLVAMGAFIPQADGARGAAFAIATAVLFAILTVLWLLAARGDRPGYRRASRLYVTGTAASAVLLAGTALLPASARMLAWGLLDAAYLAGFAVVALIAVPDQPAALTVTGALIDRFGQITLIVLGETITGVVGGLVGQPVGALTLSVGLVAVVVGFGAWWTYFDFAGNRQPRPERAAGLPWMLGHLPLTAAIAAMGAAMVSLVEHAHEGRTPAATGWLLCAGAAVMLCATMLVAASLQAWRADRGLYRPLARACAAVAVACLAVGALRPAPLVLGVALVLLLAIPWGLAVVRGLADAPDLPSKASPARQRTAIWVIPGARCVRPRRPAWRAGRRQPHLIWAVHSPARPPTESPLSSGAQVVAD
jgi:low temperature requirement protein LtrA